MMAGTGPAICPVGNSQYAVAFQANTGNLWTMEPTITQDRKLGMVGGTNPSLAEVTPKTNGFHFANWWPPQHAVPCRVDPVPNHQHRHRR
jgi:hypothetical protein